MPQIMIDLSSATTQQLRDIAELLMREADRHDALVADETLPKVTARDEAPTAAEAMIAPFNGPGITAAEAFAKVPAGTPVIPAPPVNVAPPPPPPAVADVSTGGATPMMQPEANVAAATAAMRNAGTNLSGPLHDVQLDRDGFPHDKRLHSETPKIKADGRWRQRRNLDAQTLVEVEQELRAKGYGKPQTSPTPTVSLPPPVIPPPPAVVAAPNAATPPVIPPPPPSAGVAAGVPEANPIDPFRALMRRIEGHTGEGGRLALDVMKPIHAEFGAIGWQDYVAKLRDKIPALMLRIDGLLA